MYRIFPGKITVMILIKKYFASTWRLVLWDVTLSSLVDRYQQFERLWCLCLYHRVGITCGKNFLSFVPGYTVTHLRSRQPASVCSQKHDTGARRIQTTYSHPISLGLTMIQVWFPCIWNTLKAHHVPEQIYWTFLVPAASVALSSSPHVPELFSGNALQLTLINKLYLQLKVTESCYTFVVIFKSDSVYDALNCRQAPSPDYTRPKHAE